MKPYCIDTVWGSPMDVVSFMNTQRPNHDIVSILPQGNMTTVVYREKSQPFLPNFKLTIEDSVSLGNDQKVCPRMWASIYRCANRIDGMDTSLSEIDGLHYWLSSPSFSYAEAYDARDLSGQNGIEFVKIVRIM